MNLVKGKENIESYFARIKDEGYIPKSSYQGITKDTVEQFLKRIDRYSYDIRDVILCLLNNELPNPYPKIKEFKKISSGASTAQIGSYIGILLRGQKSKMDREGRDSWIKPLVDINIIEPVTLVNTEFVPGHGKAKSPNSAYRLNKDFISLLKKANDNNFDQLLKNWLALSDDRKRLLITLDKNDLQQQSNGNTHKDLIRDSINIYARNYLPDYKCVFEDADDGDRVTPEEKELLSELGIVFGGLEDVWPDAILFNQKDNSLWFIEAVTSDGEIDNRKIMGFKKICSISKKRFAGCTTTYFSWKKFTSRQQSYNNLAPGSHVWVKEFPEKQYLVR